MSRIEQERDIETLRQMAVLLAKENQHLTQKIVALTKEILQLKGQDTTALQLQLELLQQQLAQRNQMLFGDSSEKRHYEKAPKEKKPQVGHGPKEQPKLAIVEQIYQLDKADQSCPQCGGALQEWEGQFEEAEEIDVIERQFVIKKHKRQKYRCACQSCIETAIGPEKLAPKSRYSIDFAVEVAVEKYLDHMPLERQVRKMEREGLEVDSQTLWDQINVLAHLVEPTYKKLIEQILKEPMLGVDETTWRLLTHKGEDGGPNKKWQAWAVCGPTGVYYNIQDSRGAEAAQNMLPGYTGIVMCDALESYHSLAKKNHNIILAHCWAHVRRKFVEVQGVFPQAKEVIELIGELYDLEKKCEGGDAERLEMRQTKSAEVIERIKVWEEYYKMRVLPESGIGKALGYMRNQWVELTRFINNAKIPLDNNLTERALRGPVVGRKNHYGSKSKRGMEVAGILYSLLESAKLCGEEPKSYLKAAVRAAIRKEEAILPKKPDP